jgi:hypothetical protein
VTPLGDGWLRDSSTGYRFDSKCLHPVDAAGRLVQEDLCLMTRVGSTWTLGAASVCFPSRWSLAAKIGRNLSEIHAPVPGYDDHLGEPTSLFFDRMRPDRPVWRLNWTLLTDPSLHQPDASGRRPLGSETGFDPGNDAWFRVERQTLTLLEADAIVFTIRTYVSSLSALVAAHRDAAAALVAALSDVPPDALAYKGWEGLAPSVVDWLRRTT